jgi:hypothetical protein
MILVCDDWRLFVAVVPFGLLIEVRMPAVPIWLAWCVCVWGGGGHRPFISLSVCQSVGGGGYRPFVGLCVWHPRVRDAWSDGSCQLAAYPLSF